MHVRLAPWVVAAALSPGCSLILNTGDLPGEADGPPGQIDAGPPDAMPPDANRADFAITEAMPPTLDEGAGANLDGRPVVIRLLGRNVIDPTVTVTWSDGFAMPIELIEQHPATDFNEVAIALRIPVRPDRDEAACADTMIHFDLVQAGAADVAFDVPLHCLDELTALASFVPGKTYSRIQITAPHSFATGGGIVRLHATENIEISAAINVNAVNELAGAGGCAGGPVGGGGNCAGGGGGGASGGTLADGGGGGGGGFLDDGVAGSGGGTKGESQGNDMVVPLGPTGGGTENAGGGGGGGGQGTGLAGTAGKGGGGGGTIGFVAGGAIVVGSGALISAGGANGKNGTGGATGTSGGGGGGAGGAILIRAGAGVTFTGTAFAWLTAPRGVGGTSPGNAGGSGSVGRVRVDQALEAPGVSPMVDQGGDAAGPAWLETTDPLSTSPMATLMLRARPGSYGILINGERWPGGDNGNATVTGGPKAVAVVLARGANQVCALYTDFDTALTFSSLDEAKTCVEVVYIPAP